MNSNFESTRMNPTRLNIVKTFLDLYSKTPLDRIYIKDLAKSARINRGTFYLHFLDLEDLVASIENEQLEAIANIVKEHRSFYHSSGFAEFFKPIFNYIVQNKELFKILTSSHSRLNFRDSFLQMIRDNTAQNFHSVLLAAKGEDLIKKQYLIESITNGNLSIVIRWIQSDVNLSPEEMADFISYTIVKSPLELIKSNLNNKDTS